MMWDGKRYDPFDMLDEIHREIERVFREFSYEPFVASRLGAGAEFDVPRVEMNDAGDAYVVLVELPGMKKEDIKMRALPDRIYLVAEREKNNDRKTEEDVFVSKYERKFKTVIEFPEEIVPEKIKAKYNNGILEIWAPKKSPKEKEGFEVPIE